MQSPERLYINFLKISEMPENENVEKHLSRYEFARNFSKGKILDCSCGSGYGSLILSGNGFVTGIDRSSEAIEFADKNNSSENIDYIETEIQDYIPTDLFNTIVCIETFEHLAKPDGFEMLMKFNDWLVPGGNIFITTPMLRYKDGKPYITNPYHINEMPKAQILNMFNFVFKDYKKTFFHQEIISFKILDKEDTGFMVMVARKNE